MTNITLQKMLKCIRKSNDDDETKLAEEWTEKRYGDSFII